MRAGASCAVQQTLTSEAASVLKHSLSLARRRGHAQITPLHVAATLLSPRVSLLRRACLKSQPRQASSHPLQCRALELCFNVALNRLPTTPGPILHGQPSLSNALIAALKRAQAHQRRGCIEQQQQQPLLAIKVELEQLVLSILDDPSVSRVMREAGFSSTAVKNNLEDCSVSSVFQCYNSSGGIYSTPSSPPSENPNSIWHSHFLSYTSEQNPLVFSPQKILPRNPINITDTPAVSVKEDIKLVVEVLLRKKRKNTVIVGDSASITEGLVTELMGKVEKGDVPEELKSAHFIKFHFSAAPLKFMKREEVELNVSDLKRKVETLASGGKGVIIYTGDLRWTVENTMSEGEDTGGFCSKEYSGYSPVDHLVGEIGRLLSCYNNSNTKVWLVATANYQTYMRSQMKQPPLDVQWALQAVSVPSGGLGLSLKATSVQDTSLASLSKSTFEVIEQKPNVAKEEQLEAFICCPDCTSNYEKEVSFNSNQNSCNTKDSDLAYWLKPPGRNVAEKDETVELKRKWIKLCQSLHQVRQNQNHTRSAFSNQCSPGKNQSYNSYPWWPSYNSMFVDSKSISFAHTSLKPNQNSNSVPRFRRQQSCHIEFNFGSGNSKCTEEPNLDSLRLKEDKDEKITLALGNSQISDAVNSTEKANEDADLCKLLQENVPWHSGIIPAIVEALMNSKESKKDTWLVIQGNDLVGKRRIALGIAESLIGSADLLFYINLRTRQNTPGKCSEVLQNVVRNHGRLVAVLEDIDFADPDFLEFLADSIRAGKMGSFYKKDGSSCEPIFILTKADLSCYDNESKKMDPVIQMEILVTERTSNSTVFGPDHKRKTDWDFPDNNKIPRKSEMESGFKIPVENGEKELTPQLSSNTLDLNMKADEEESDDQTKEFSPISSDLTSNDQPNPLGFLDLIENHFILNRDLTQGRQMTEMFLNKIRASFEEIFGSKNLDCFTVEHNVLEQISLGSATFLNSLFEEWLKNIFQPTLKMVNNIGKEGISMRLSLRGNAKGNDLNSGFKGSCLPKSVPVSYLD
nr:protein SMAX1-LIKE 4-like [Coffea arabica]XP_027069025.1 protein SMAX1-LIKE 4-like [Coffea arabica]